MTLDDGVWARVWSRSVADARVSEFVRSLNAPQFNGLSTGSLSSPPHAGELHCHSRNHPLRVTFLSCWLPGRGARCHTFADRRLRLLQFKNGKPFETPLPIHRQSCYLFGRERRIADVPTDHPSCSKQQAVIQFRYAT